MMSKTRTQSTRCNTRQYIAVVRILCHPAILLTPLVLVNLQLLMNRQDQTLTSISGVVDSLREQAKVMGREVVDQNV